MKKKYLMIVLGFIVTGTGCSSAPKSIVDMSKVGEEEVIQTYGKHDELKKADQFKIEDHLVTATGMATIPADSGRPEAAVKLAQASAKSTLAKTIETKLESYLEIASENTSQDSQEMRELVTEVSKLTANELKPGKTYYEKVKTYGSNGVPSLEYRAWSQIEMSEDQFKRHLVDSIRRQEGKIGLSSEFHKSVSEHWNKMLNSDESKPSEAQAKQTDDRKPASETKSEATNGKHE